MSIFIAKAILLLTLIILLGGVLVLFISTALTDKTFRNFMIITLIWSGLIIWALGVLQ